LSWKSSNWRSKSILMNILLSVGMLITILKSQNSLLIYMVNF